MLIQKREGYAGIYIHYPFCIKKCFYCDFYSNEKMSNQVNTDDWIKANIDELEFRLKESPEFESLKIDSIFFGGGTPSLSDPRFIEEIIYFLYKRLKIEADCEITVEMNPEHVSQERLAIYHGFGVNRISVGIQSFNFTLLDTIGRHYEKSQYNSILDILDNSNIQNYSIDLIYGIPNQTKDDFYSDLKRAISHSLNHISIYSLTLEKNTKYYKLYKEKKIAPPDENLQVELFLELSEYLYKYNFYQYEVSNYAKIHSESRHNLKYWTMEYYLGIGPSASGFTPQGRYTNHPNISSYWKQNWNTYYEKSSALEELALTLFRITYTIQIDSFISILSIEEKIRIYKLFQKWKEQEFCKFENNQFQWTKNGITHLNDRILEIVT